jgi:dTDP-4-dehydrorhamnose reductase
MKILILGASGAIGHVIFKQLSKNKMLQVYGTVRDLNSVNKIFSAELLSKLTAEIDVTADFETLKTLIKKIKPDVVFNAIGIIKQLPTANQENLVFRLNAKFPQELNIFCHEQNIKMIQLSTDCVFDGQKGHYVENDIPNAADLYGKSKAAGEIKNFKTSLTIRTSTIGHELHTKNGLLEWFLSQDNKIKGFRHALYSGVTTLELAKVIENHILPNPQDVLLKLIRLQL